MDYKKIAIKMVVTFVEAAVPFWALAGYKLDKAVIAGAVGAGLSAVYNVGKQLLVK